MDGYTSCVLKLGYTNEFDYKMAVYGGYQYERLDDVFYVILKEDLQYAFSDFAPYLGKCQFHDCAHLREPGCAVTAALVRGEIEPSRYRSYERLYEKAKEYKAWERKQP